MVATFDDFAVLQAKHDGDLVALPTAGVVLSGHDLAYSRRRKTVLARPTGYADTLAEELFPDLLRCSRGCLLHVQPLSKQFKTVPNGTYCRGPK